jgi:hypothetical protein
MASVESLCKFGLIVTGKGEERFLPRLFRSLSDSGVCRFEVITRISQRSEITSPKRQLRMLGTGKEIPDRDVTEIGLPARSWLKNKTNAFVLLIDDLEVGRAAQKKAIFKRYRDVLDKILGEQKHLASVHFLVNMMEAYYFSHSGAINQVLGTSETDFVGDVEEIRNPKGLLKSLLSGFDEITHGQQIMGVLDINHILGNLETCASLRTLFAWCKRAIDPDDISGYRLDSGVYDVVTGPQLWDLPCLACVVEGRPKTSTKTEIG